MEKYNMTCGITKIITIRDGDECVIIPITGNKKIPYRLNECQPFLDSIDQMWEPCGLAIHGTYDEECYIRNIMHNEVTECMEQKYNMPIEKNCQPDDRPAQRPIRPKIRLQHVPEKQAGIH